MRSIKNAGFFLALTVGILLFCFFCSSVLGVTDIVMDDTAGKEQPEDQSYALIIQRNSEQKMTVQFVGNQMFHADRYLGFGVSGRPMLALRYMAEKFGFTVNYEPESGRILVSKGQYSFGVHPGKSRVEICWGSRKLKEQELTAKPLLKNNTLYMYSLDISDLLGLITTWNDSARTWDVLYRDYTVQDLAFPTVVNDDRLTLRGLLLDAGTDAMPLLEIVDTAGSIHSSFGSVSMLESGANYPNKYLITGTVQLRDKYNKLLAALTIGQRIIYAKDFAVAKNIEAKELVAEPPYRFTSPSKGYIKITEPQVPVSGTVEDVNDYFPAEIVVFVKSESGEILHQENIPIVDGQFNRVLELENGKGIYKGLYKITVNYPMAGPRGLVYPEITNFYVEYR